MDSSMLADPEVLKEVDDLNDVELANSPGRLTNP
jgi:hypothetical protein